MINDSNEQLYGLLGTKDPDGTLYKVICAGESSCGITVHVLRQEPLCYVDHGREIQVRHESYGQLIVVPVPRPDLLPDESDMQSDVFRRWLLRLKEATVPGTH